MHFEHLSPLSITILLNHSKPETSPSRPRTYHGQAIFGFQVFHSVSSQDGNLGFGALLLSSVQMVNSPPKCWDLMGFIMGVHSDLVGFHGISWGSIWLLVLTIYQHVYCNPFQKYGHLNQASQVWLKNND
jgi:hypothetical protein